jgi:hypothetical protein
MHGNTAPGHVDGHDANHDGVPVVDEDALYYVFSGSADDNDWVAGLSAAGVNGKHV